MMKGDRRRWLFLAASLGALAAAQGCPRDADKEHGDTGDSAPLVGSSDSGEPEQPDFDADGWPDSEDCAPENADVFPGAVERCNAIDDDCDGQIDEADSVDMRVWYPDNDGDGYGAGEPTFACVGPDGGVEQSGDCDDGLPEVNPAAAEICENQIDDDCDGDAVECRYADEIGLDEAAYFIEHPSETEVRVTLAGSCDVDGDGWGDLIMGTLSTYSAEILGGEAAYVVRGDQELPANMADAWASVVRSGRGTDDFFGFRVACGTDLDGDGATSVLVTEVAAYTEPEEELLVYVLDSVGAGSNDVASAVATIGFPETTWHVLRSGGDIDADGVSDVVVGTNLDQGSGSERTVSIQMSAFPLSITGEHGVDDAKLVIDFDPDGAFEDFDVSGDYDGDGLSDIAVGGEASGGEPGFVYTFSGPVSGSQTPADAQSVLGAGSDWYEPYVTEFNVANVGDFDGDGRDDLLVGSRTASNGETLAAGAAYLVPGPPPASGELTDAPTRLTGTRQYDQIAPCVAHVGDVDGDGNNDLFATAINHGDSYDYDRNGGAAHLVYGPLLGTFPIAEVSTTFYPTTANEDVGEDCVGVGDVTGDGLPDFALTSEGAWWEPWMGLTIPGGAYLISGGRL